MTETLSALIAGKKVLILGYGREGKSSLKKIQEVGGYADVAVSDKNPVDAGRVRVISGSRYLDVLDDFEIVFKSPGVVLPRPAQSYACEIVSQTEIFFRRYSQQIIGITGTKGKSTATTLLYHILKSAGIKTALAGNIGIPVFDIADEIEPETKIVVELSCHQLEYMTSAPHFGVLMNIFEEHLDHYGTMEKYVAAKEKIYRNQTEGDILLCNVHHLPQAGTCRASVISIGMAQPGAGSGMDDAVARAEDTVLVGCEARDADVFVGDHEIDCMGHRFVIPEDEIKLFGRHNFFDIGIVYAICRQLGMSDEDFRAGLCSYEPLPHRLQYIGTVDGVRYYDDSISTIGETTIQALEGLQNVGTVLIGGMDRGVDYHELEKYLDGSAVDHIILMAATGARIDEEIRRDFPNFRRPERLVRVDTLAQAVGKARELTKPGKCCVLSPAAASYGIFKNFEERGEVFAKYVLEGRE